MSDLSEPELLLDAQRILESGKVPEQADLKELLDDLHAVGSSACLETARRLARLALLKMGGAKNAIKRVA